MENDSWYLQQIAFMKHLLCVCMCVCACCSKFSLGTLYQILKTKYWRWCYYPCVYNREGGTGSINNHLEIGYLVGGRVRILTHGVRFWHPGPKHMFITSSMCKETVSWNNGGILMWGKERAESWWKWKSFANPSFVLPMGRHSPLPHLHFLHKHKGVSWGEPCH